MSQPHRRQVARLAVAALLAVLALVLRWQAATHLPADYDEAIYLRGAQTYADGFRNGNFGVIFTDESPENPPLMKLLFGLALTTQPGQPPVATDLNAPLPASLLHTARAVSVVFGAAAVFLLALVSPAAGVALAVHTLHIRYASEVLLEALPFASSLLCVLAYQKSDRKFNRWLALSAVALGITAASKYLYCIVAIAILADWLLNARRDSLKLHARNVLIWGALAVVAFLIFNPYLWPDPVGRLVGSLTFHRGNSSLAVNTEKYVAWQPLVWLSAASTFRPDVLWLRLDPVILILAALGVMALWRRQRVHALWLFLGLVFLLLYSNKWPQYPLIVLAPLCLSAGLAVEALWRFVRNLLRPQPAPHPQPLPNGEGGLVSPPSGRGRGWEETRKALIRNGPALALAGVVAVWVVWLGQNWHQADPSFQAALNDAQRQMRPDETVLFAPANPYAELASRPASALVWDWHATQALGPNQAALDFHTANQWLNEAAAGQMGVWLLTYQPFAGDPADTLRALLQRQAHLLSPAFTQPYSRSYELSHFRFDAPYQPITSTAAFDEATIETNYGQPVGLSSAGCAQMRPAQAGGLLEAACLWQTQSFSPLAWDTQVSLRLFDAANNQVLQADQMIARSGFPTSRFEGMILGNHFIPLPADLPAGSYELRVFAYGADGEYSPRILAPVVIDPA
jgi:hypothetical protein